MVFLCALIPLASLAVSFSFGGATAPLVIAFSLIYLVLFGFIKRPNRFKILFLPLCLSSVVFRLFALWSRAESALGNIRAIILIIAVVALSAWAGYKGSGAILSATPIFAVTAILALYVVIVSFNNPSVDPFAAPRLRELISAIICPLSLCLAFSYISGYPPVKRLKGAVIGIAVCAVFIIFRSAEAEFGFISVPLTACASALEIKTAFSVILKRQNE